MRLNFHSFSKVPQNILILKSSKIIPKTSLKRKKPKRLNHSLKLIKQILNQKKEFTKKNKK